MSYCPGCAELEARKTGETPDFDYLSEENEKLRLENLRLTEKHEEIRKAYVLASQAATRYRQTLEIISFGECYVGAGVEGELEDCDHCRAKQALSGEGK